MNKRVFAILLAIAMIASSCVLFASAAVKFAASPTRFIDKGEGDAKLATELKPGTHYDRVVKPVKASTPTVTTGTTKVTADNVDDLVSFGSFKFKTDLAEYFSVDGTISDGKTTITFTPKAENRVDAWNVTKDIDEEGTIIVDSSDPNCNVKKTSLNYYKMENDTIPVAGIKEISKLCTVTTGVHFYGKNTNNLVASEIALVKATVKRDGGILKSYNIGSSAYDVIYDLLPGDVVTLTTELKNKEDEGFYGFNCWVDGSNVVMKSDEGKPNQISFTMDGKDVAVYANYVDLKPRFTIDYSVAGGSEEGHGKLEYVQGREIFKGDAQISVMQGKTATFNITPDEGYEITKVVIDGKNIASFIQVFRDTKKSDGTIDTSVIFKNLQKLIQATGGTNVAIDTNNPKAVAKGEYTFEDVQHNHTIVVTFGKKQPLEAPSGMELPTITAERDELATGAADATNADGSAVVAAGGVVTTLPAENGAAAGGAAAVGGVVNPATGSGNAIAVFAVMAVAAGAAFVTMKKKED